MRLAVLAGTVCIAAVVMAFPVAALLVSAAALVTLIVGAVDPAADAKLDAPVKRTTLALVLALLSGCYRGPGAEDPSFPKEGSTLPLGIVAPSTSAPGVGAITGVYPSAQPNDPFCCWLGPNASFEVRVPARANRLIVTLFVPPLAVFKRRPQGVRIAVDSGAKRHYALSQGLNFTRVPITPEPREHIADVSLDADVTFVPRDEHINGDTRELSLYLKAVRAAGP